MEPEEARVEQKGPELGTRGKLIEKWTRGEGYCGIPARTKDHHSTLQVLCCRQTGRVRQQTP